MQNETPMKYKTNITALLVLIVSMLPCACIPRTGGDLTDPFLDWSYADLLLLEGAEGENPERDLLAAYARQSEKTFEIRLDFLEISDQITFDLYLAIDNQPDGTASLPINSPCSIHWDTLVKITPDQNIHVFFPDGLESHKLSTHMILDSALDSLILRLGTEEPNGYAQHSQFQVFITPPGSNEIANSSDPFGLQALSRIPQASILLAFWDTFPAQALRRWNGAHTGPFGSRHGLSHLLQASFDHAIPITLLDLRTPDSLSALEFIGQLGFIRELERQKLVILPDPAFGDPEISQTSLDYSRQVSRDLGLPTNRMVFAPFAFNDITSYSAAFADLRDRQHIQQMVGTRLIPIPGPIYARDERISEIARKIVAQDGLTVVVKNELINLALDDDPANLLVLGSSLPSSPWADAAIAPLLFRYLAAHPWIKVLGQDDLLSMHTIPLTKPETDCIDLLCTPSPPSTEQLPIEMDIPERRSSLLQKLRSSPPGVFTEQAWQAYLTLSTPELEPARNALMTSNLDIVNTLLKAAQWEDEPQSFSDCDQEICILASENLYLVLDLAGGYVPFFAVQTQSGVAQVIGPISQFTASLSDPSEWVVDNNKIIDPADLPGAFIDRGDKAIHYEATTGVNQIRLHNHESHTEKIFWLQNDTLAVGIESSLPLTTIIPVAFAPQKQFFQDWGVHYESILS